MGLDQDRWTWFLLVSRFYYLFQEYLDEIREDSFRAQPQLMDKMKDYLDAHRELEAFESAVPIHLLANQDAQRVLSEVN